MTTPDHTCVSCNQKAKRVQPVTIRSLVRDEARARLSTEDGFRFCPASDCDAVYSRVASAEVVGTADVSVEVFQKTSSVDRPVCYCFDYSVRDVRQDGDARKILADIEDQCRRGLDQCEEKNPQGRCCLANVRQVYASRVAPRVEPDSCCAPATTSQAPAAPAPAAPTSEAPVVAAPAARASERDGRPRAARWAAGGAIAAALASSACCWLPLSLIALGVSAGGIGAFFETYRVWFLGGTAALLALGFYLVYFRKPACAPGDACATPNRKLVRLNQLLLWTATAFVVAFALFPNYVGYLLGAGNEPPAQAQAAVPAATEPTAAVAATTRTYHVEGMSCEGCTTHIKKAIERLPGVSSVKVVYADKITLVTFAPGVEPKDAQVLAAIDDVGFEARVKTQGAQ